MVKGIKIKKCMKCGATVQVIEDCTCKNCGIQCCGEKMVELKPNTVDCAVEKHLPQVEIVGSYVIATVNHVMEEGHYIEWIALDSKKTSGKKFFLPGETLKAVFPYIKGSKILAYCNKHGLWSVDIK